MIQRKKKMNRNIRTITKYIINDYKRVFSDVLTDLSTLISNDFRAINLMMNDLKLIKNSQADAFFSDDFVKSLSIIANKIIIVETNISISSRTIVFKMFVSVIFFRPNRSKIDKSIASSAFLIVIAFTPDRSSFFNLRKLKQTIVYEQSENEPDVKKQSENLSSFISDMTLSFNVI